ADAPTLANENNAANSGIRKNFFISNLASKIVQALERTLTCEFDGNPCANCESRIDLLRLRAQCTFKDGKLKRAGGTSSPAGICVVAGPPFRSVGAVSPAPDAASGAAADAPCGGVARAVPEAPAALAAAPCVPAAPAVPVTAPAGAAAAPESTS